jgi:hypothetical protein
MFFASLSRSENSPNRCSGFARGRRVAVAQRDPLPGLHCIPAFASPISRTRTGARGCEATAEVCVERPVFGFERSFLREIPAHFCEFVRRPDGPPGPVLK